MQELQIDSHKSNGRWTHQEHLLFLEGLRIHGKNWKKIEQLLQTRTGSQIRSHAQKFFLKMNPTSQTAQKEPSQGCQLQEEQEDATANSKQTVDSPSQSEDSYFLSKMYTCGYAELSFPIADSAWTFGRDSWIANMREFRNAAGPMETPPSWPMDGGIKCKERGAVVTKSQLERFDI